MHDASKLEGRPVALPRETNTLTGRESSRHTGFNDVSWGKATRIYAKYAGKLSATKISAILAEAREFAKPVVRRKFTQDSETINVDEDDGRIMVDNSDISDYCKLQYSDMNLTESFL
jgi:hypothetical protein